ncbi:MAG: sarcosine oxidase [Pelagibacteraceae bacterium]|nr:MAG: sarcosine oxidase [Pelagibacteraceae bacterium]
MKTFSSLFNIHKKGKFGDFENKNEKNLLKIEELSNLLIFQLVKFKSSNFEVKKIKIDNLNLPDPLKSSSNSSTRILWMGPDNWLVISSDLNLLKQEEKNFDDKNFALTDISHSRTIIEIEGNLTDEVIKKGCPLDINDLKQGDCANSVYNGMSIVIDFISDDPKKVRIFSLRSFGESLHHSITDACLEYGYIGN